MLMFRTLLLLLSGCQLIINHNEFAPASDASGDAPSDASSDAPPPVFESDVASTIGDRALVVISTTITWPTSATPVHAGAHAGFGTNLGFNAKNNVTFGFEPGIIADSAQCVCKSRGTGADDHECTIAYQRMTDAQFIVWSTDSTPPDYDVDIVCVAETTGTAGTVVTVEPLLLAGARIDPGVSIQAQSGTWLGAIGGTGDAAFVDIAPGGFEEAPQCLSTSMPSGNHNGRIATVSPTRITGSHWGEEPSAVSVFCSGPSPAASTVTPAPLVVGSVTLPNASSDFTGSWLTFPFAAVAGVFELVPDPSSTPHFAAEPFCACSPIVGENPPDTRHLACQFAATPTTSSIRVRMFDAANGQTVNPTGDLGLQVICLGVRS